MAKVEQILQNLIEEDVPEGMHQHIMRTVAVLRLQRHFFMFFILLGVSFMVSLGNVLEKLMDFEVLKLLNLMTQSFEININEIQLFMQTFVEFFPVWSIVAFMVQALLIIYMMYLFFVLRRVTLKGRMLF